MSAMCRFCHDTGVIASEEPSPFSTETCRCSAGIAQRIMANRAAISAYRLNGSEPVTSVSHAAQWDEMESALDTVRLHARHCCRSCDTALPSDAKCGERCERCEDELAALGKPAPMFDRLDRWVIGILIGSCAFVALLLIKTMVWG